MCRGVYSPVLVRAWEEWADENESLNDHPGIFPSDQAYVVFILEMGGSDLEKAPVRSFDEARSILLQVAAGLAVAEAACQFEHRDLHWGNVLIHRTQASGPQRAGKGRSAAHRSEQAKALSDCTASMNSTGNSSASSNVSSNNSGSRKGEGESGQWFRLNGQQRSFHDKGVRVAIIDFSLSRLQSGARVHFSNLSQEPSIFQGDKGHPQFDTYREMKNKTKGRWDRWCPQTNSLWLKYLAEMLQTGKKIRFKASEKRAIIQFKERMAACRSAKAALDDELFNNLWRS
ncbi:unnamed protein product [Closterium sp. NIES-65]|nr:unnamed protein product [Closterium sp. NIES-65]